MNRWYRRLHRLVFLVTAWLALPVLAAEPDRSDAFTASDIRDLPRGTGSSSPANPWFGSAGAAYIRAEDGGRIWLTPFSLDARLNRNTALTLEATALDGSLSMAPPPEASTTSR